MLTSLLILVLVPAPDTLRVFNSHSHTMTVEVTVGDKTLALGPVESGDTAKFVITIPAGVKQLLLRAFPPDNPLGQITFTLEVKPEKPLFWSFDDSKDDKTMRRSDDRTDE